jgi:hypothetical protein
MSDKLKSIGKIAWGVTKVIGSIGTATGHGLASHFLFRGRINHASIHFATISMKSGLALIEEGSSELKH